MVKQYIGILLISLFLMGCISEKRQPVLQKGVLDISDWKFETDGAISLDGEWEIYWMKLLEPENFKSNPDINNKNSYLSIP